MIRKFESFKIKINLICVSNMDYLSRYLGFYLIRVGNRAERMYRFKYISVGKSKRKMSPEKVKRSRRTERWPKWYPQSHQVQEWASKDVGACTNLTRKWNQLNTLITHAQPNNRKLYKLPTYGGRQVIEYSSFGRR